jgi:5-(carboxyamino)imidazole ribonucleotide mutase
LLAARILAAGTDPAAAQLRERLAAFADELRDLAVEKGRRLRERS